MHDGFFHFTKIKWNRHVNISRITQMILIKLDVVRNNTFPTLALLSISGSRRGKSSLGHLVGAEDAVMLHLKGNADYSFLGRFCQM